MSKIITLFFCLILLAVAGLIVSGTNNINNARDPFESLTATATDICAHGEYRTSNPNLCLIRMMTSSIRCYLPITPANLYAQKCFEETETALNKEFRGDLSDGLFSDKDVLTWVRHAATEIDNYDYKNVKTHYKEVAHYFSSSGKKSFNKFFNNAYLINNITFFKTTKSVALDAPPQLEAHGEIKGIYTWEFGFPITAHFSYDNPPPSQQPMKTEEPLFLHIKIVRSPKTENQEGIGIDEWTEMTLDDWDKYQEWLKHQKSVTP